MRSIKIAPGEFYHVYNRGNLKQNIFTEERDWVRFLFLLLYFQSPIVFYNISRSVSSFVRHRVFNIEDNLRQKIIKNRTVELTCFCLMPNHFHLIVRETKNNGISNYMQRIQNSYTKYCNIKYQKSGHLLQGPFKIVRIKDNNQLLYLSTYIHRNPIELNRENPRYYYDYTWSSLQDYTNKNRWGELLKTDIIACQFSGKEKYENFVNTSVAKLEEFND